MAGVLMRIFLTVFGILITLIIGGCQYIGTVYNGISRVTVILLDDRSFSDDITDTRINIELRDNLIRRDVKYGLDIEVTVFEGAVLLTGALPDPLLIDEVCEIAWNVPDVYKVYNYIRLASPLGVESVNQDAAVSAKIRMELTFTRGIDSSNYKLVMENGVVYVMGIFEDSSELDKTLSVIKNTPGVEDTIILGRFKIDEKANHRYNQN